VSEEHILHGHLGEQASAIFSCIRALPGVLSPWLFTSKRLVVDLSELQIGAQSIAGDRDILSWLLSSVAILSRQLLPAQHAPSLVDHSQKLYGTLIWCLLHTTALGASTGLD